MPPPSRSQYLWLAAPVALLLLALVRANGTPDASSEPGPGPTLRDPSDTASEPSVGSDPRYRVLTREILAATADDDLEYAIVQHVSLVVGDRREDEARIVRGMHAGVRAIFTTWWLDGEVNNGGFNQYFWNPTGALAEDALEGLQLIGATERAKLLEEAIRIRDAQAPQIAELKRKGSLEAFSESYKGNKLGPLDDRFFKLKEDASRLRIAYVRAHPEQFVTPR